MKKLTKEQLVLITHVLIESIDDHIKEINKYQKEEGSIKDLIFELTHTTKMCILLEQIEEELELVITINWEK